MPANPILSWRPRKKDVIDKPGRADECSDRDQGTGDNAFDWIQAVGIYDFEVVETD
jgi:hypothetical protein